MKHQIPELLLTVSDHAGVFGSKAINAFGAVSIGAGAAITAIGSDAITAATSEAWISPDYVMAASIFGSVCFGVKHLYDFFVSAKDRWKAKKQLKLLESKKDANTSN